MVHEVVWLLNTLSQCCGLEPQSRTVMISAKIVVTDYLKLQAERTTKCTNIRKKTKVSPINILPPSIIIIIIIIISYLDMPSPPFFDKNIHIKRPSIVNLSAHISERRSSSVAYFIVIIIIIRLFSGRFAPSVRIPALCYLVFAFPYLYLVEKHGKCICPSLRVCLIGYSKPTKFWKR